MAANPTRGMTQEEMSVYFNKQQLWVELREAQGKLMEKKRAIADLESECTHRLTEIQADYHETKWVHCRICNKSLNHVQGT